MSDKVAAGQNMRSLERAIDVLEILDAANDSLRLSEVARRAGLHIATTQRILNVLEARGRVERDAKGFRAGLALLFGAHAYLANSPLVAASRPVLQDLATVTGLTSSLFARTGFARAVVERVEGDAPMRYVLPTGEKLPLTLGAGIVLAAYLTPAEIDAALEAEADVVPPNGERSSRTALLEEMEAVRSNGYHYSFQGRAFGVSSVAAPILDKDGNCVAGIQVAGGIEVLTEDRVEMLSLEVRRASSAVSNRI